VREAAVAAASGDAADTADTSEAAGASDTTAAAGAVARARTEIRILRHAEARGEAVASAITRWRNTKCSAAPGDASTETANAAATSDGSAAFAAHTAARRASAKADSAIGIQKLVPRARTASDGDQGK
jgi:hypothetical protein